jgi:hypothetical protein
MQLHSVKIHGLFCGDRDVIKRRSKRFRKIDSSQSTRSHIPEGWNLGQHRCGNTTYRIKPQVQCQSCEVRSGTTVIICTQGRTGEWWELQPPGAKKKHRSLFARAKGWGQITYCPEKVLRLFPLVLLVKVGSTQCRELRDEEVKVLECGACEVRVSYKYLEIGFVPHSKWSVSSWRRPAFRCYRPTGEPIITVLRIIWNAQIDLHRRWQWREWFNQWKGKDFPLQAWNGSWGSRRLRLLDLLDFRHCEGGKVVTLTHRPPSTPGVFLVLIFRSWVDPRAHGSVGSFWKNPQRHYRGSIPRPSD